MVTEVDGSLARTQPHHELFSEEEEEEEEEETFADDPQITVAGTSSSSLRS